MFFTDKQIEIVNKFVDEIHFLKNQNEEIKRVNKIYFDELKKYEKENLRYKKMINQLEDITLKLSNYIEEKEKC